MYYWLKFRDLLAVMQKNPLSCNYETLTDNKTILRKKKQKIYLTILSSVTSKIDSGEIVRRLYFKKTFYEYK